MNSPEGPFKKYISTHHLFTEKDHLLLAVSGGVDSVVLCELCFQCGFAFSIAHVNFQLRGEESDADELFVKELAEKYKVPFFIQKFETERFATDNKLSIQVAARELRYNWFAELLDEPGNRLNYLLTAHHADDNMETIAMNFFKGSGINGLKGILPKQNKLVRPLLLARKEDLLKFAKERGLSYREDSSNSSNKYTRNYFRNELLPAVEKIYPGVKENLLANAERFREINIIYQSALQKIISKLVVSKGKERHIPVLKLRLTEAMSTVFYELLKEYGFTSHQTTEAIKLLESESGKYILSPSHRLLRNRQWLIISPLQESGDSMHIIQEAGTEIFFTAGKLSTAIKDKPGAISNDPRQVQVDAGSISFPLLLRKWKTGDYFYPLGMPKEKKVSRFLSDLKLSMITKQEVWVIESDKRIIWVAGYRIDDRFKVTGSTTKILSLSLALSDQIN